MTKKKPKTKLLSEEYGQRIERGRGRPITITLNAEWIARLDALTEKTGANRSEVMRRGLETLENVTHAADADKKEIRGKYWHGAEKGWSHDPPEATVLPTGTSKQ